MSCLRCLMDPPPPPPPPPPQEDAFAEFEQVNTSHEVARAPKAKAALVLIPMCRKGDRASIESAIVHRGASVAEVDAEGNTPLHVAVEAPRNEIATVQVLLEHLADPNAVNYIGAAPLHYVCLRKGNWRGLSNIMLENGANVDCQTHAGKTALHFASENQLAELVEVLCVFGANTQLLDTEANTPLHLALHPQEGGRDTVKRQIMESLVQAHANFQMANLRGITPLHLACQGGFLRCVQYLVDLRADVQAMNSRGETSLHFACSAGHKEVVSKLVEVGPHIVDQMDSEGNTPLHAAAAAGHLDAAMVLLRGGADCDLQNFRKQTAYDVAKMHDKGLKCTHNPELVQVLKENKKAGNCRQS